MNPSNINPINHNLPTRNTSKSKPKKEKAMFNTADSFNYMGGSDDKSIDIKDAARALFSKDNSEAKDSEAYEVWSFDAGNT